MKTRPLLFLTGWMLAGVCLRVWAGEPHANQPAENQSVSGKFVRLARDAQGQPEALETAIVRYTAAEGEYKGSVVDLIGAVHIGERDYYRRLNQEFGQYEAVLYELVVSGEARGPKAGGQRSTHPVGLLQQAMKDFLQLEHQLEQINYGKTNLVHADMSLKDVTESMARRGESFLTMFFRVLAKGMAEPNKHLSNPSDWELLLALFNRDRAMSLKRLLAEQFQHLEGAMDALNGPDGSTILTERNKVALRILAEHLGKGKKRLGIFYGAGHLPGMEERLLKEFGLRRTSERWIVAWDLRSMAQRTKATAADGEAAPARPGSDEKSDASQSSLKTRLDEP